MARLRSGTLRPAGSNPAERNGDVVTTETNWLCQCVLGRTDKAGAAQGRRVKPQIQAVVCGLGTCNECTTQALLTRCCAMERRGVSEEDEKLTNRTRHMG